jgi:hypothetical protein
MKIDEVIRDKVLLKKESINIENVETKGKIFE